MHNTKQDSKNYKVRKNNNRILLIILIVFIVLIYLGTLAKLG